MTVFLGLWKFKLPHPKMYFCVLQLDTLHDIFRLEHFHVSNEISDGTWIWTQSPAAPQVGPPLSLSYVGVRDWGDLFLCAGDIVLVCPLKPQGTQAFWRDRTAPGKTAGISQKFGSTQTFREPKVCFQFFGPVLKGFCSPP